MTPLNTDWGTFFMALAQYGIVFLAATLAGAVLVALLGWLFTVSINIKREWDRND